MDHPHSTNMLEAIQNVQDRVDNTLEAIQAAEDKGVHGLPDVIALSVLYSVLRSQADHLPPDALGAMVHLRHVDGAMICAGLMTQAERKVESFWVLANESWKKGEKKSATIALRQALSVVDSIWLDTDKVNALSTTLLALARLNDREGLSLGLNVVSKIQPSCEAFAALLQAMEQLGDIEGLRQALNVANAMSYTAYGRDNKRLALVALARAQSRVQDREGLEATIDATVQFEGELLTRTLHDVLTEAAKGFARTENVDYAFELARRAGQELINKNLAVCRREKVETA